MTALITAKADFMTFPMGVPEAEGAGRGISNRLAVTGAGTNFAIPEYWKGRFLRVKAVSSAFKVSVSVGAKTLVYAQSSPPDNAVGTAGWPLADGETIEGIVPKTCTYFNYVAAGTGDLHFTVTEPPNAADDSAVAFP